MTQQKKRREYHPLPSGKMTIDVRRYIREWRELAKPIERDFGYELYGFGNGMSFIDGKRNVVSMTTSFALRYYELHGKKGKRK